MLEQSIEQLVKKLGGAIPSGFQHLHEDMERNFRAVLQNAFSKMDLVTREEFDVQRAVLAKTRAKVEALEKQVALLEQKLRPE